MSPLARTLTVLVFSAICFLAALGSGIAALGASDQDEPVQALRRLL
jgi:hypothetical protein